jgi:transcriptional pleiotropic regulator of transition state genes
VAGRTFGVDRLEEFGGKMNTGMARKIDNLGRIVIPAETRRLFNIREGDQIAIAVEGDRIMLHKIEGVVSVGEHSFEVNRDTLFDWERSLTEEIGSREPEDILAEIKRRLGL